MKIGIFDPYLDTLGGGERYAMTLAEHLGQQGHTVNVFWNDEGLKKSIKRRLGINLGKIDFVEDIFSSNKNLLQKWQITKQYNLIFYLSDGSVPFLFAKKNILHFQVPFTNVGGRSILNKIKFRKIDKIVCNSKFTKRFIDKEYGGESEVVYPPVDVKNFTPGKKDNIILAVGRFTHTLHAKKQEILIEGFKRMMKADSGGFLGGWKLVLVGGMKDGDREYVKKLRRMAKGMPVKILVNVDFTTLQQLYGKAKIFWHAAGFGENEGRHPERMEHFGMVAVEAMAAGCVPVVINKGGLPEIVQHKVNGFLWKTKSELAEEALQLIAEAHLWQKLSLQAIKASQKFSKKVFYQKIDEIIKN